MENQVEKTYTSKNTYLLTQPFPMEEIKLGKTKEEVLRFIYKGENPTSISKRLNIARSTTIQHLNELRKKGLVKKGSSDEANYGDVWTITDKGKFLIEKCVGFPAISSHKGVLSPNKKVRGHAFIWKIKPNKKFNWIELLACKQVEHIFKGISRTPRIIINGKKIWLGQNYITLFEPKWNSFFNKNASKSRNDAVFQMNEDIEDLKRLFEIAFNYKFTCRRQHYGFVDNAEAKFFIKKKKKMLIKNEKGYWFSIDFSQNKYKEAETIHERDAEIDGLGYQGLMNSHEKTNFKVTPDFILQGFHALTQASKDNNELVSGLPIVINDLKKQIKSHLKLIQEYRKENIRTRKQMDKKIESIKLKEQRSLNKWF